MGSKFTVFFDGACHLCSREIRHYTKIEEAKDFEWVNIASKDFLADRYGLDPKRVHLEMHAMDESGHIHTGVKAFVEIWKRLPRWRVLAKIIQWPVFFQLAQLGYILFARLIRPVLPKRKNCEIL